MAESARADLYGEIYARMEKFIYKFYADDETEIAEDSKAATDFILSLTGRESHNSAELPWAVLNWIADEEPSEPTFWAVMVREWDGFDRIPHEDFEATFENYICPPRNLPDEVKTPVTIYRGQSADDPKGLSWTLNRAVAESFAHGHRGMRVQNPIVFEMQVELEEIAFYTNDREEEEVVLCAIPD